jgi:riboflavin transporter FmnP
MNNEVRTMKRNTHDLTIAGICLALAQLLPLLTGQIPQIGAMLAPMHIAVLLCGFLCTTSYAAIVGFTAPLLRFAIFGMPPLFPIGIAMSFELMTYALVASVMYKRYNIYISLITAMLTGRVVWGIVMSVIAGVSSVQFGLNTFIVGAFATAAPGIVLQLLIIPLLVRAVKQRGDNYESQRNI